LNSPSVQSQAKSGFLIRRLPVAFGRKSQFPSNPALQCLERAAAPSQRRLTANSETHKSLRIAAIEADISMNDAINQAVDLWLKEHQKRKGVKK
jgi:hypothetical protein